MSDAAPRVRSASPTLAFLFSHPAHFIALGFGAGLAPFAPGTFGTLVAIPIAVLFWTHLPDAAFAITVIAFAGVGIWAAQVTGRAIGGGHFFPEQNPDETVSELAAFLQASHTA